MGNGIGNWKRDGDEGKSWKEAGQDGEEGASSG